MIEGRKQLEGCCEAGGQGCESRRRRRVSLCQCQSSRPIALYPSIRIGWVSRCAVMRGTVLARRDCRRIIRLVLACTANPEASRLGAQHRPYLGRTSGVRRVWWMGSGQEQESVVRDAAWESRTKPWGFGLGFAR